MLSWKFCGMGMFLFGYWCHFKFSPEYRFGSHESHPLRQFLKEGVKCFINSDVPLLFGCDTTVSERDLNMDIV